MLQSNKAFINLYYYITLSTNNVLKQKLNTKFKIMDAKLV